MKHLYGNACDTYVAESIEEAFQDFRHRPDGDEDESIDDWTQDPDDRLFYVHMQLGRDGKNIDGFILPATARLDTAESNDTYAVYYAPAKDWAEANPKGFFCSTEY